MFKELLTSIGIGDSKIDTKLEKTSFRLDEDINGVVDVHELDGLEIDHIELSLIERKKNNDEMSQFEFLDEKLASFTIENRGSETIPFTFPAIHNVEDVGHTFVIITHVFVSSSVDYYDEDEVYFESVR